MGRWFRKRGSHIVDSYAGDPRGFELAEPDDVGGGGSGLVVGEWALIDFGAVAPGTFPVDPTTLDLDAVPVPSEIEMRYVRPADLLAGFSFLEPVGGEFFDGNNDVAPHDAVVVIRSIIPADTAIQVFPSGDTSTITIDLLRRRTLG